MSSTQGKPVANASESVELTTLSAITKSTSDKSTTPGKPETAESGKPTTGKSNEPSSARQSASAASSDRNMNAAPLRSRLPFLR
ncbi:hypothetical protein RRF57_012197 [Xylaria bambusicola]|uniref:Uncharacterized protein n=1 Tax=Xylaria bambusicola TaxID=326684 RepID=A0AAN7Z4B9_9PEZI